MAIRGYGGVTRATIESYIRDQATLRGIDPNYAVSVFRGEGASGYSGDRGKSFGPFQLYTGGGVGNRFIRDTGLDLTDPATWRQQVQYALNTAANEGWGAWHGRPGGRSGPTRVGLANARTVPLDMTQVASADDIPTPRMRPTGIGGLVPDFSAQDDLSYDTATFDVDAATDESSEYGRGAMSPGPGGAVGIDMLTVPGFQRPSPRPNDSRVMAPGEFAKRFNPPKAPATYTVQRGDSLWDIAAREYGDGNRYREIAEANQIRNPRSLQPGTILTLPGRSGEVDIPLPNLRPAVIGNRPYREEDSQAGRYGGPMPPDARRLAPGFQRPTLPSPIEQAIARTTTNAQNPFAAAPPVIGPQSYTPFTPAPTPAQQAYNPLVPGDPRLNMPAPQPQPPPAQAFGGNMVQGYPATNPMMPGTDFGDQVDAELRRDLLTAKTPFPGGPQMQTPIPPGGGPRAPMPAPAPPAAAPSYEPLRTQDGAIAVPPSLEPPPPQPPPPSSYMSYTQAAYPPRAPSPYVTGGDAFKDAFSPSAPGVIMDIQGSEGAQRLYEQQSMFGGQGSDTLIGGARDGIGKNMGTFPQWTSIGAVYADPDEPEAPAAPPAAPAAPAARQWAPFAPRPIGYPAQPGAIAGAPAALQRVVSPQGRGIMGGISRLLGGGNPATFTPAGSGPLTVSGPGGVIGAFRGSGPGWTHGTTNALGGTNALSWNNSSGTGSVTVAQDPWTGTYYGPSYSNSTW